MRAFQCPLCSELRELRTDFVETHFVDDRLDVRRRVRKERHAPLAVVETGRARDELAHATCVGAADARVAGHEFFALLEIERIPILPAAGAGSAITRVWPVILIGTRSIGSAATSRFASSTAAARSG